MFRLRRCVNSGEIFCLYFAGLCLAQNYYQIEFDSNVFLICSADLIEISFKLFASPKLNLIMNLT